MRDRSELLLTSQLSAGQGHALTLPGDEAPGDPRRQVTAEVGVPDGPWGPGPARTTGLGEPGAQLRGSHWRREGFRQRKGINKSDLED